MNPDPKRLLTILGPTASGKTRIAVGLAAGFDGEIISADSRQVYRGMDLGTGKDLADYEIGGRRIPAHLIDILDPDEDFSVFEFQRRFLEAHKDISQRGRLPILCGGTALYLDSVLRDYRMPSAPPDPILRETLAELSINQLEERLRNLKPTLHNNTDLETREHLIRAIEVAEARTVSGEPFGKIPSSHMLTIGLRVDPGQLRERIKKRLKNRLEAGLIDEANALAQKVPLPRFGYFGLEYRHLARFLTGEVDKEALTVELAKDIAGFAKRQRTWFRKMERNGVAIHWFDSTDLPPIVALVESWLKQTGARRSASSGP